MEVQKKQVYANAWDNDFKWVNYDVTDEAIEKIAHSGKTCSVKFLDEYIIGRSNDDLHFILTDAEHPMILMDDFGIMHDGLYFDAESYKKNQALFESRIIKLITKFKGETFVLGEEIYLSSAILDALINNKNIVTISLENRYLDRQLYETLLQKEKLQIMGNNIAPELLHIFDGTIFFNMFRPLFDGLSYEVLKKRTYLNIKNVLSPEERENIRKYATNLKEITFSEGGFACLRELINSLNNTNLQIILEFDQSKTYDIDNLKALNKEFPQIIVKYGYGRGSLADYIRVEEGVKELLKPIEGLELSPLEKYIFAFNACKRFRRYKENNDDRNNSRAIMELFKEGNEHIVCVGFANLLFELCKRLDIPCMNVSLSIEDIKDDKSQIGNHARNLVRISDSKYNLDNLYMGDATWSNNFKYDSLVTALMTPKETLNLGSMVLFGETSIVTSQTYEEMLEIIFLEYRQGNHYRFDKTIEYFKTLYPEFIEKCLNTEAFSKFSKKVIKNIEDYRQLFANDEFMRLMFDFIQEKMNKPILGETLIEASINLTRKLNPNMTVEELESYRQKLIADNYFVFDKMAPAVVAEYQDGSKRIIENEQNKFGQGPRKI